MGFTTAYQELRAKILLEYLEKYKDTPSKTIARMLVRDHPDFYKDIESARSHIRLYRGTSGQRDRNKMSNTKYYRYEPTRII